jgi:hypothetical protein
MHVRAIVGLWHMDCNLVEQKISGDPHYLPAKVGHATNPLTLMEEIKSATIASSGASGRSFSSNGKIALSGGDRSCAVFDSALG